MVAQAQLNGTAPHFYSDAEMRDAVRAHQLAYSLNDATVAARIGISVGAFERWMNGTPSYTVARARLIRFCRGQNLIPEPTEIVTAEPEPEPQRSVIAYMADREPEPEPAWVETNAPEIETATTESIREHHDVLVALAASDDLAEPDDPLIGAPLVTWERAPGFPFPLGFSVVWNLPATALNTPSIRLAKTGILFNKALRDQMGSPDAVMVALWRDETTCRLAVASAVDGFDSYAIRLPKSGEIAQRVRTVHIGPVVPDGTYAVTKEGDCWITGEIALNPVDPKGALT